MARLNILEYPDPRLRTKAKPVEEFDAALARLAQDMLETMYDAPGIGLAAIQLGEPIRMLVIDLAKEGEPKAPQIFQPRPRTMSILVFLATMLVTVGLAFLLENLRPHPRPAKPVEQAFPEVTRRSA